jgi:hypothetical protein
VIERVPSPARSEPALVVAGNSAVTRGLGAPRSVAVGVHVARMAHAGNGAVSRAMSGPAPGTAPGGFAERLGSAESGEPIPDGVRDGLESSFGASLGDVRLHQGSRAGGLADEVNAKAFTVGKDIYFGKGRFDPSSSAGYHLLAHEVTHTQQQSGGGSVSASSISVSDPGDASERDAERIAERLTAGRSAGPVSGEQPHVARSATDVIPDFILNGVKSAITAVPGYVLLTYIIGKDPITDRPVPASPVELVEKLLTYGPFGANVGQVLQAMDVLRDIYSMVTAGLAEHNLTVARIGHEISTAWDEISITNGIDGNIAVVRRHIDAILTDVAAFVRVMVNRVLEAVRRAAAEVAEPHLETPQIKPVWELAKKVFHYDPLRGNEVNAPTVEILGDFLHLIGKDEALAQMRERGTLQQAADWLDAQFATFIGIKNDVFALFRDAWNAISPENLPNLLNTLPQLAQRAWALVQRVAAFAATVVGKVLELIKNALLGYLSAHASEIKGFRLLTVMIEQNPFTGQPVPRTAENLIGGFIALLPNGEATYQKLAESGVIAQAAGRITSAMTRLGITVELITSTFRGIWDSLSLEDLAAPLAAFERVMAKFRDPLNRIVEFVTEVVKVVIELILKLMNFPSDLLGSIIDNATRAIDDIEKDPVAFLMNMLEALKRGFLGFFDGIVGFLVEGLGGWLFRGLGAMGITRPPDLSLKSILNLVLQVLGISVDMLWQRLAMHMPPERVAQMRGAVDTLSGAWAFLKEVQQDGVAAVWRHIESMLGNLWETILNLAKNWIMTEIVDRVIAKIISMLDPTGIMAIVNSFIAFFKAVQSAIDYIRDILEIVNQYVTTFAQVAAGNVVPGAEKVTRGLANAVPIAIGFLANQVGLGNVPEKVVEIIGGLREMINEALDWLIKQALSLGQSIMSGLGLGGEEGQQPPGAAGAEPNVNETQPVTVGGNPHQLFATYRNGELSIEMASEHRDVLITKIRLAIEEDGKKTPPALSPQTVQNLRGLITILQEQPERLRTARYENPTPGMPQTGSERERLVKNLIHTELIAISQHLQDLGQDFDIASLKEDDDVFGGVIRDGIKIRTKYYGQVEDDEGLRDRLRAQRRREMLKDEARWKTPETATMYIAAESYLCPGWNYEDPHVTVNDIHIEHKSEVVDHWNKGVEGSGAGRASSQTDRDKWNNDLENLDGMCSVCNNLKEKIRQRNASKDDKNYKREVLAGFSSKR